MIEITTTDKIEITTTDNKGKKWMRRPVAKAGAGLIELYGDEIFIEILDVSTGARVKIAVPQK